jgi:transcriptional regulator with XRE-family HTH domain
MGNRIKDILDQRGIKPAAFAKSIGVPQTTMSTICTGKTEFDKIRIGNFIKIARGLGMTSDELYGETLDGEGLRKDEATLLDTYRSTDVRGKQTIMLAVLSQRIEQPDPERLSLLYYESMK